MLTKTGGISKSCKLVLECVHFNIQGETDINKNWRIIPSMYEIMKEEINVGDVVCIDDPEIADALLKLGS